MVLCCAYLLSQVQLFETPCTVTLQAPLSMRILQARVLEFCSRESYQPRDWTQVSCIAGRFFAIWATREAQEYWSGYPNLSSGNLPDPGIKLGSPALQAHYKLGYEGKPIVYSVWTQMFFLIVQMEKLEGCWIGSRRGSSYCSSFFHILQMLWLLLVSVQLFMDALLLCTSEHNSKPPHLPAAPGGWAVMKRTSHMSCCSVPVEKALSP